MCLSFWSCTYDTPVVALENNNNDFQQTCDPKDNDDCDSNNNEPRQICDSQNTNNSLLITEVGGSYFSSDPVWFEIFNFSSNEVVNLCNFSLNSIAWEGRNSELKLRGFPSPPDFPSRNPELELREFPFPDKIVNPLTHIIVRANYSGQYSSLNKQSADIIYLGDGDAYPFFSFGNGGHLEILLTNKYNTNETIDFIKFGSSQANINDSPLSPFHWSGDPAPSYPNGEMAYGQSISRKYDLTRSVYQDSNQATDWEVKIFSTRGGINDVTSDVDDDGDGIPDSSEMLGKTFAGLPLYEWGARPNQKDLFIEIDYMEDGGNLNQPFDNYRPRKRSLEKIVNIFQINGYTLHFDVGDLFDKDSSSLDPENMDLGGGNELPFSSKVFLSLDSSKDHVNLYEIKAENMVANRTGIFYYMVLAHEIGDNSSETVFGIAEFLGNDSIIGLGSLTLYSPNETNYINLLASTIMHEFGHNLGLLHGGDSNVNYKPNYISVMNYLYTTGLPTIGSGQEGDRYFFENYKDSSDCSLNIRSLTDFLSQNSFIIDFSDGTSQPLNEMKVNENLGLGRVGSASVDFNCSATIETNIIHNLNPIYDTSSTDVLTDHNDWDNLQIVFTKHFSGNQGLRRIRSAFNGVQSYDRPIFDPFMNENRQEIIFESKDQYKKIIEGLKKINRK